MAMKLRLTELELRITTGQEMSLYKAKPASRQHQFLAPAPRGLVELLHAELLGLGITKTKQTPSGVRFTATLQQAYAVCVWSRLANRVLLCLGVIDADDEEQLYDGARSIDWQSHFTAQQTFNISLTTRATWLNHTQYGALKVKDAIVDQFRANGGVRPNVERRHPEVRLYVHLHRNSAEFTLHC
jgi:23S rRNA (guanine2445-N2)-methyltransferase / 23S rRNA (guanine2069-N7)-methyltransferase